MDFRDDDAMNERVERDGMDVLEPTFIEGGHVDDGTIHTWLDGAFDDLHSATVERHVAECDECRAQVAEARGFIAGASRMVRALDAVPADVVPATDVARSASRIIAAADATRVIGGAHARDTREVVPMVSEQRAWYARREWSAAAALLLMVAGGSYVLRNSGKSATFTATADSSVGAPPVASVGSEVSKEQPAVAGAAAMRAAQIDNAPVLAVEAKKARGPEGRMAQERDAELVRGVALADGKADTNVAKVASAVGTEMVSTMAKAPVSVAAEKAAMPVTMSAAATPAPVPAPALAMGSARAATSGASGRAADNVSEMRRRDEAPPSECWSVLGEPTRAAFRLPAELQVPEIDGVKSYGVRWIGWPDATSQQMVRMRVDNDGRLSGESDADEQRVRLVLQRIVNGWQGTATHTIGSERTTQKVQLKRVNEAMCNP